MDVIELILVKMRDELRSVESVETKLTGELCYQAKRSNITESLNTKIGAKSPR